MIVGLLGMSKVGKDEFAQPFIDAGYIRYAFGDLVKKEYAELNNLPLEEMFNHKTKEFHRPGIIAHGEKLRDTNPCYWVNILRDQIIKEHESGKNIIITDIRRIPEIDFIKELMDKYGYEEVQLMHIERPVTNGGTFDTDKETSHALIYAEFNMIVTDDIINEFDLEYLVDLGKERLRRISEWTEYNKECKDQD